VPAFAPLEASHLHHRPLNSKLRESRTTGTVQQQDYVGRPGIEVPSVLTQQQQTCHWPIAHPLRSPHAPSPWRVAVASHGKSLIVHELDQARRPRMRVWDNANDGSGTAPRPAQKIPSAWKPEASWSSTAVLHGNDKQNVWQCTFPRCFL
jgi:hypothetical protein